MNPQQGESPPNSSEAPQCNGCDLSCEADCPPCEVCGDPIHEAHNALRVTTVPTNTGTKELTAHGACTPGLAWVNAYEVTRHFGGREEGGWWFNAGEPLASLPIRLDENPTPHVERLQELFGEVERGNIYHSTGGAELHINVELKPGARWPERKPRYE